MGTQCRVVFAAQGELRRQRRVGREPVGIFGILEEIPNGSGGHERDIDLWSTSLDDEEAIHRNLGLNVTCEQVRDEVLRRWDDRLDCGVHRHDGEISVAEPLSDGPAAARVQAALDVEGGALKST